MLSEVRKRWLKKIQPLLDATPNEKGMKAMAMAEAIANGLATIGQDKSDVVTGIGGQSARQERNGN